MLTGLPILYQQDPAVGEEDHAVSMFRAAVILK
jgi:hypothetical protein